MKPSDFKSYSWPLESAKDTTSPIVRVIYQMADYNGGIRWTDEPRYSGLVGHIELNLDTGEFLSAYPADRIRSIQIEEAMFRLDQCVVVRADGKYGPDDYKLYYIISFIFRSKTFLLAFEQTNLKYGKSIRVPSSVVILFGPFDKDEVEKATIRIAKRIAYS